jgi:hypothetical protein
MTAFVVRRARNFGILGLCALILTILYGRIPLHDWKNAAFVTGWLLVVLVLAMALFNARKKLPFLPLFAASQWLQFHVYTGLLAAIVFLVHTGGHLPAGGFDFLLWCGFVLVAISGFVGIGLSRVLPARLRSRGEAVLYERIPAIRTRLIGEVEDLVTRSIAETGSPAISELYISRLRPFLAQTRPSFGHLFEVRHSFRHLLRDLRATERYLSPKGRQLLDQIEVRLVAKDSLDYQYTIHTLLRGWLFFHVPLSFALLPLIAIHILLYYAFGGV